MGCAGSRPSQLIPSLSNHHHHHHHHMNSPQKGFILFNAKTIEYLQANELEIKEKLKQRCEQKLAKAIPQSTSSKSLLNNAKRTLLFNSGNSNIASNNTDNVEQANNKSINTVKPTKSDASLALNGTLNSDLKLTAIDSAVDYVLKYALNDFDIENFKSSNHLSMKQIRKDIMKKNNSVSSLSKMNNSISMNNQGSNTLTRESAKSATLTKGYDASFYKQALNTAIDEFGLFVQENFIIINEFDKNAETVEKTTTATEEKESEVKKSEESTVEALKLKEALEVARHNFYKGKISMVCLTKAGGYVVKEVKDQPSGESDGAVVLSSSDTKAISSSAEDAKKPRIIPQINIEDVDETEKKLEEKKIADVEELMYKAFKNKKNLTIDELFLVKSSLIALLDKCVESITNYTKDSETETTENLMSHLEESKRVIELLSVLNETEQELTDEKLTESVSNLNLLNRELKIEIEKKDTSPKTSQITSFVDEIDDLITKLPKSVVSYKSRSTVVVETGQAQAKITEEQAERSEPIDIKKEIAFSILNVGEVLAKTIDYYSNEPDTAEIKDLIELSNKQAKCTEIKDQGKSSASSLVSPSSSSSTSVGSIPHEIISSPTKENAESLKEEEKANLPTEPTTPIAPPQLKLDHTETKCETSSTPKQDFIIKTEIDLETEVIPEDSDINKENNLCEQDFQQLENQSEDKVIEDTVNLMKQETKSSSSSSDVLSNDDLTNDPSEEKPVMTENFIETEANKVVFRNGETLASNVQHQNQKRMSLDEELFYHLEEVDKKVKYMNETCSEDDGEDDDDDLDDENFDYDESVELENANDERLFHPRTPAKIKSEVRNNRTVDLQEEIKQISNVIQDLVQTINVRNSTTNSGNENLKSSENSDNNNADSEDGSQNSGSGGDYKTKSYHYNRNSNGSHTSGNIADRKSINSRRSIGNQSLNSSIPISVSRQKILKKTATLDQDDIESNNDSFADYGELPMTPEAPSLNNSNINKSAASQRFRSKLPVKK